MVLRGWAELMGIAVPVPCDPSHTCAFAVIAASHIDHQNKNANDCAFSTALFVERALQSAVEHAGDVTLLATYVFQTTQPSRTTAITASAAR